MSQQLLEPFEIAFLGGGEETGRELLLLLARGLEARPSLRHVAAGPCDELAGVLLARADNLRDPSVGLVEHLAQQERSALFGATGSRAGRRRRPNPQQPLSAPYRAELSQDGCPA